LPLHSRGFHALTQPVPASTVNLLPLYHRPGSIVIVDYDRDYTDEILSSLPKSLRVEVFSTAKAALNFLQQEPPLYERDFWMHQQMVENWHDGSNLIRQVTQYWQESIWRHKLSTICIMDHNQVDALEALADLQDWPGQRILTTGQSYLSSAISAFNQGLIDQVVVKDAPGSPAQVAAAVAKFQAKPNARYDQIWRSTLSPARAAALGQDGVAHDLNNLLTMTMVEWIVIGEPFGILGLDAAGTATWLQLEPTAELDGLAELAEHFGATQAEAAQIRSRQCVTDVELQQALGRTSKAHVQPAFSVGRTGGMLAALHRLDVRIDMVSALSDGDLIHASATQSISETRERHH
jgi:hypothetical protein